MVKTSREIQQEYYTRIAPQYDAMHLSLDYEHYVALDYLLGFMRMFNLSSVVDIGCGTGRAVKFLHDQGIKVLGVEPVEALIDQARQKHQIPPVRLICGRGESLPFAEASFDVACEFGVLHHVARPDELVKEMMRVARKAIFLSDSNRFGQGSKWARIAKLLIYKVKLWGIANWIKTWGRKYTFSEAEGLAYSYSIYDSFDLLAAWADKIILIPTKDEGTDGWLHPLLTASHVLLCAIKA